MSCEQLQCPRSHQHSNKHLVMHHGFLTHNNLDIPSNCGIASSCCWREHPVRLLQLKLKVKPLRLACMWGAQERLLPLEGRQPSLQDRHATSLSAQLEITSRAGSAALVSLPWPPPGLLCPQGAMPPRACHQRWQPGNVTGGWCAGALRCICIYICMCVCGIPQLQAVGRAQTLLQPDSGTSEACTARSLVM